MHSSLFPRRRFISQCLGGTAALTLGNRHLRAADGGLIESITKQVIRDSKDKRETWFHPRSCMVPTQKGAVAFMTLQVIRGSDYFGPVHWTTSSDLGKTWSEF